MLWNLIFLTAVMSVVYSWVVGVASMIGFGVVAALNRGVEEGGASTGRVDPLGGYVRTRSLLRFADCPTDR